MFLPALIPNICIHGYRFWKWRRSDNSGESVFQFLVRYSCIRSRKIKRLDACYMLENILVWSLRFLRYTQYSRVQWRHGLFSLTIDPCRTIGLSEYKAVILFENGMNILKNWTGENLRIWNQGYLHSFMRNIKYSVFDIKMCTVCKSTVICKPKKLKRTFQLTPIKMIFFFRKTKYYNIMRLNHQ